MPEIRFFSLLLLMKIIYRGHALICDRLEYRIHYECCPMCPIGHRVHTDCSLYSSTSCLPCIEGTFMSLPSGFRKCFPCRECDPGSGLEMRSSCTATQDTECKPLEGFYCIESAEENCKAAQRHTSCQPGEYISQKGTPLRDTVCLDCRDGTFSDGTFTSCHPKPPCGSMNQKFIKAGTDSGDAECEEISLMIIGIVLNVLATGVAFSWCTGVLVFTYCCRRSKRRNDLH